MKQEKNLICAFQFDIKTNIWNYWPDSEPHKHTGNLQSCKLLKKIDKKWKYVRDFRIRYDKLWKVLKTYTWITSSLLLHSHCYCIVIVK